MAAQAILFKEKQRYTQFWLWAILLGVSGLLLAGFVYRVFLGSNMGNHTLSDIQLGLVVLLVGVGLPLFFFRMRLITKVLPGEVRVRFSPFQLKAVRIPLHLVRDFERLVYNPIGDYGGWGIRWSSKGKAYNMSGNEGVQLYFYNRKPILIGSQRSLELFEAIRKAKEMGPGKEV
ncbi:DUF6141 family protein [Pontibacter ruber]|uniref:DUF6141 family protein n=1 Tax=Pontibacter ruber TaxID=1343895 RepID=A0ABW5CXT3_9BACT|nr:DUF6141 family protein [Pontibacter ruber]